MCVYIYMLTKNDPSLLHILVLIDLCIYHINIYHAALRSSTVTYITNYYKADTYVTQPNMIFVPRPSKQEQRAGRIHFTQT